MSERSTARLRVVVIALIALNVLFFVYTQLIVDERAPSRRIEQLQINPERIKLMAAATRGPGGQTPAGSGSACLQWGPLAGSAVARAESALAELNLAQPPLARRLQNDRAAYLVREPDAATISKLAELQRSYPGSELKAVPCPL